MKEDEPSGKSGVGAKYANLGHECARLDCDELTPFDMAAIAVDGDVYCSPKCVRVALESVRGHPYDIPSEITLLDPQNHVDKSPLPGVDETEMVLTRRVKGLPDAERAVDEIEQMYPGEFRV